jgi:hypothetical protein
MLAVVAEYVVGAACGRAGLAEILVVEVEVSR